MEVEVKEKKPQIFLSSSAVVFLALSQFFKVVAYEQKHPYPSWPVSAVTVHY